MGLRARLWIMLWAGVLGYGASLPSPAAASLGGHNGRIAWSYFVSNGKDGGDWTIDTIGASGGGMHQIGTCSDFSDFQDFVYCQSWDRVSFSPDGRQLAWDMIAMSGHRVIVVANPDGSAPQVIDHGSTESDSQPTFSPSGQRIAYVRGDTGSGGEIVTSNLAGGDVQVLSSTVLGTNPVWAPNGKTILFNHGVSIWSIGSGGQAPRRLILGAQDPDFSPDGRRLVYVGNRGFIQSFGTLFTARADGSHRHKVPTKGSCCKFVQSVVFSPDGKRLAFGSLSNDAGDNLRLSTLPVAGGQPKLLHSVSTQFNGGSTNSLSWQPGQ